MVSESNHGCHAARRRSEGTRGSECGRICSDHRETLWPHHKEGPFKVNRDSSIEMANTIRVISKPNRLLSDRRKKGADTGEPAPPPAPIRAVHGSRRASGAGPVLLRHHWTSKATLSCVRRCGGTVILLGARQLFDRMSKFRRVGA